VAETDENSDERTEKFIRQELYEQFEVSKQGQLAIKFLLPLLDKNVKTNSRYDIDLRSKILAEIALYQAYDDAPKFKMFGWASLLLGIFDLFHALNPSIYGVVFIALATLNGFVSSLRSPSMMAAELSEERDDNGMPATYRAKAHSSVNTNVTLVLFVLAVGVQLLVTSSVLKGELIAQNIGSGILNPAITALALFAIPLVYDRI
jgi:hypothetical protein